jgi:hypothetical protein
MSILRLIQPVSNSSEFVCAAAWWPAKRPVSGVFVCEHASKIRSPGGTSLEHTGLLHFIAIPRAVSQSDTILIKATILWIKRHISADIRVHSAR